MYVINWLIWWSTVFKNKRLKHFLPLKNDSFGTFCVVNGKLLERTTALRETSTTNWIFPRFSPPALHEEKCGKFQFVVEIAHKAVVLILISL